MATIANWNGHTFVVSPSLIRSFTGLKIKGSCETTEKNSDKQKYEEKKYGDAYEINMTVELSAQMGVTNVYSEAMSFVHEATAGATGYFYLGGSKLIPAEMMLIKAEVEEIQHMPGRGDRWISAMVKLTFKQATNDKNGEGGRASVESELRGGGGSGGTGGGGNNGKTALKSEPLVEKVSKQNIIAAGLQSAKNLVAQAKDASKPKNTTGGLQYQVNLIEKATQTRSNTSATIDPTTQRSPSAPILRVNMMQ